VTTIDGRRARGAVSRSSVTRLAVDRASVDGLAGLTIGSLASGVGYSKSGVASLFGNKEQLQLATIDAARDIFVEEVIAPALSLPGGRERLIGLLENWIRYSESRVFAGGCFFAAAAAEIGSRPGAVRDAIAQASLDWDASLARVVSRAVALGELSPIEDMEQIVFEVRAILDTANSNSLLFGSSAPYDRARTALTKMFR
jgi:AcrR family transcriptional regulator